MLGWIERATLSIFLFRPQNIIIGLLGSQDQNKGAFRRVESSRWTVYWTLLRVVSFYLGPGEESPRVNYRGLQNCPIPCWSCRLDKSIAGKWQLNAIYFIP